MIKDAHDTLMDIHSPPRPKDAKELAKELLAQVCGCGQSVMWVCLFTRG